MEIPYTVSQRPDTGLWNAKIGIWLFLASEVMLFGGLFSAYIFLRIGADRWPHGLLNVPIGTFNTAVLIISSMTMVMAWASVKMRQFVRYRFFMAITLLCAGTFLVVKAFEYNEKFHHFGVFLKDGTEITGHELRDEGEFISLIPDAKQPHQGGTKEHGETGHGEGKAEAYIASVSHGAEPEHGGSMHGAHAQPIQIPKKDVFRWSNFVPRYSTYFAIYYTLTGLHALHIVGGMVVLGYFAGPGAAMYRHNPEHLANRVECAGLFWHFVDLVWIFLFPVLYLL
jgi:cytochrome c oxidase subunit 3